MILVGVDLSGPTNIRDTAVVSFVVEGERATLFEAALGVGDEALLGCVAGLVGRDGRVVVGLDAPLSYNPGGGDRPADRALRQLIGAAGLRSGSIMPPTMTRMVYLTVRGMSVARALATLVPAPDVLEVHPGAALALHGAPVADVLLFKREAAARGRLNIWLREQGLDCGNAPVEESEHMLAACAAAFGAWRWAEGRSAWLAAAAPPLHPYDFAC
jgi:predicted nuclease with RNAse H fold